MMNIEIEGLAELNANLGQLAKVAEDVVEKEISDIALDLGGKASNAAPVESGDLRGELARPQKNGKGWRVGASLPYTRKQHEGTWFKFKRGGGAKFLEKPFRANVDKYIKRVGDVVERNLK